MITAEYIGDMLSNIVSNDNVAMSTRFKAGEILQKYFFEPEENRNKSVEIYDWDEYQAIAEEKARKWDNEYSLS